MEPGRGEQESGYGRMGQGREWERGGYGPHAGRGPKGYTRSDERIQEDICERLTQHPAIDASDIEIEVKNGEVTLRGTVESRAVKHLVENMVETVTGVKDVHNQLRVAQFQQQGGQAPTPGGQTQGAQPQGQKR
jgi:osmotically-inducible protein OsmY